MESTKIKIDSNTIADFIKRAWPALLFYIVGDIITTIVALEGGGFEYNPVIAWAMSHMGYLGLVAIKMVAVLFLFGVFIYKDYATDKYRTLHWHIAVSIFTVMGLILVGNNLYAISIL